MLGVTVLHMISSCPGQLIVLSSGWRPCGNHGHGSGAGLAASIQLYTDCVCLVLWTLQALLNILIYSVLLIFMGDLDRWKEGRMEGKKERRGGREEGRKEGTDTDNISIHIFQKRKLMLKEVKGLGHCLCSGCYNTIP